MEFRARNRKPHATETLLSARRPLAGAIHPKVHQAEGTQGDDDADDRTSQHLEDAGFDPETIARGNRSESDAEADAGATNPGRGGWSSFLRHTIP